MTSCLRFVHPSTFVVAGPTGCGKTFLIKNVLQQRMFTRDFDKIYWCYAEWQPAYQTLADDPPAEIEFIKGLPPTLYDSIDAKKRNLLVIDDLMSEAGSTQMIADFYTKGSHHRNLSVLLFTQNLFHQGKEMRTISLNSHYIITFKNPRANDQISTFARQAFPKNTRFVCDSFADATSGAHGYMLFDFRPETPDLLRLRTKILPSDNGSVFYIPTLYNDNSEAGDDDRCVYKPKIQLDP